jgi:CubicO group peptidase (beta-lactamase class C family)
MLVQELNGFDEFVAKMMEEWEVPGLAISIVKDGDVIFSHGFGYRDVENKLNVTPKTLFAIGSCTKAFTAVSMGILVDEGKLEWDKPVRDYMPDFRMYDSYVTENMTPRDLLTHRSGLPRHDLVWYGSSLKRKELIDRLRYLEPSKGFRSAYQYQNLMYVTAGYLVGYIAGCSWEEFIQDRILDPLEMNNTNFSVTKSQKSADFAFPYKKIDEEIKQIPFYMNDEMGPAGTIDSNVNDITKWLMLNLNKGKYGEKQIISEANLNQIQSPQIFTETSLSKYKEILIASYGMGWVIQPYRENIVISHGGNIDGFTALTTFMPQNNIGIVILTNINSTPITEIIAFNVYDRLLGLDEVVWNQRAKDEIAKIKELKETAKKKSATDRREGTQPSHPLEDYTGVYEHLAYGVITIDIDGMI